LPQSERMPALEDLLKQSPDMHGLMERVRRSQNCLQVILPMLPPGFKSQVLAGPIDQDEWCLLVRSPAVSTKLRQLLPRMVGVLQQQNMGVQKIRITIQRRP
jgi:hypothetical protein